MTNEAANAAGAGADVMGRAALRSAGFARARHQFGRAEPLLYALWAATLTLFVATTFYASMRQQTALTSLTANGFEQQIGRPGEWSAPLDDVFIHFDFARATARGRPFQWSEGNGYSSGGTSLFYPLVLAFGYWLGFDQVRPEQRDHSLMVWAGIVACTAVFGMLLGVRRCFRDLPRWTSWLAPPLLLGIGALSWSLFSGMEVALFLALWTGALLAWDDLCRAETGAAGGPSWRSAALGLGLWSALLTATRPEGLTSVVLLSLSAGWSVARRSRASRGVGAALLGLSPALLVLGTHALCNLIWTGETTAAGALVKLELYHPYLTLKQVYDLWKFHVEYQIFRVTEYHMATSGRLGWIPWAFAACALGPKATRRYALLLWFSAAAWVLTVALNGQVRWQNERYTMPAVAWLMLASGLGIGGLLAGGWALGRRGRRLHGLSIAVALTGCGIFAWHHAPRFREQVWFFGRASRNIRDQHLRTGRLLHDLRPTPRRVLVGDAGAIPYAADLPALDVIGLGGYHGLPFARASRLGVAASLELIERMPAAERPDVMAIYPSWFKELPLWFGERWGSVPVFGNVICGGFEKVLYATDWRSFEGSAAPLRLGPGERVQDEIDFGDVVSEQRHDLRVSVRGGGAVEMKLLPNPSHPARDLWDAGRTLGGEVRLRLRLVSLQPRATHLLLRVAPPQRARLHAALGGVSFAELMLDAADGWVEPRIELPGAARANGSELELWASEAELVVFHAWVVGAD